MLDSNRCSSREGQRYFELGRPLLSLFRLCDARSAHAMSEPHGPVTGQRGQPR